MKSYSIQPGKKIELHIPEGFYSAAAMVSIKAVGLSPREKIHPLSFKVTYKEARGFSNSFHLSVEEPYFFAAGTFNGAEFVDPPFPGPFFFVEVESVLSNPPVVVQIGFTSKLA